MAAPVIRQHINPALPAVLNGSHPGELFKIRGQVVLRVIPGEMQHFCPDPVEHGRLFGGHKPHVQPLGKVHRSPAVRKLGKEPFPVRAGQKISVQQLDFFLPTPELREVSHRHTPQPLLLPHDTKTAPTGAAP